VIVIPAVDLRGGRCVRLRQGRGDQETIFADDPVAMARRWADAGAERLHVVDLDGAFAGTPRQTPLIAAMVAAVAPMPVEVGGGLRDEAALEAILATGARWAVVGTRAAVDHDFLRQVCRAFPDRIIVAVDGHGPRVAIRGWTESADITVHDLALRARDAGAAALLYTDVSRDGTGEGPNVEATAALAREAAPTPVLASGGVATLDDVARLAAMDVIAGVVIGRALYTGTVNLRDAIDLTRPSAGSAGAILPGGRHRKGGEAPLRA
jgi:phosphoribosylformimino-5-aminoimidazole carboxamide ribotide isomerase